ARSMGVLLPWSFLIAPNVPDLLSGPLFGGGRATFGRRLLDTPFGNLLVEPKAVVFARPIHVDSAISHGLERALHPDGPDVDMRQHNRDEDDPCYRVHHLRGLHL